MKNFANMMKQAQKIQAKMAQLQEELSERTVEATSGGGMVTVVANGKQEVLSIKIDPEVVSRDDIDMLEDLIVAAVNEAKRKAEELMKEEMNRLTGGLSIPGLFG
jgi:DNA-binding YbaB/EbfC family protein